MSRKFFVQTFGCQMNEHDSQQIASNLQADGFERTDDVEHADLVILNTCCIRENADNKFYGHLGHLKSIQEQRPGMQIAVGGCLAQNDAQAIVRRAPFIDAVFGTHNISRAAALIAQSQTSEETVVEILSEPVEIDEAFPSAQHVRAELSYAAWVTIQIGCDNSCAFCIVPAVRGPEQSRPFGALIDEVTALADKGTVEVTLLGQNVNSYGRDLTTRLRSVTSDAEFAYLAGEAWANDERHSARPLFGDLLRAVGAVPGIRRVRFTSPHPKDLRPETIAAMAETPAVCEQLHLPVQSGSNNILKAMRRGYTVERYLERLAAARAAIPDLAVTTDLIVGFPGETDDDFDATLALAAEARFDSAFTFIFSPRPGTRAAEMSDRYVPADVISERFTRLKEVIDRSGMVLNRERIGAIEEVIIEGVSRRDASVMTGRTRQGKLVNVVSDGPILSPGTFGTVRIVHGGAHHLGGELIAVESAKESSIGSSRRPFRVPVTFS